MSAVTIAASLVERIREHVRAVSPEEGCGLLTGAQDRDAIRVVGIHPSRNVHDGDRKAAYRIDPRLQFDLQRKLRGSGFDVIGAFHSHPSGRPEPSRRDLAEALAGFLYLIAVERPFELRAFALKVGAAEFREIPLAVPPDPDVPEGADRVLDLRGEICPYTFIRAKLALEDLALGTSLAIVLDHPPAFESVPRSLALEGQDVVSVERSGTQAVVLVRKEHEDRAFGGPADRRR